MALLNVLPEASVAVHDVRRVRWIDREHTALALAAWPAVELAFTSECHALSVAAGRAVIRKRQMLLLIEQRLCTDDDKVLTTGRALTSELNGISSGGHS